MNRIYYIVNSCDKPLLKEGSPSILVKHVILALTRGYADALTGTETQMLNPKNRNREFGKLVIN